MGARERTSWIVDDLRVSTASRVKPRSRLACSGSGASARIRSAAFACALTLGWSHDVAAQAQPKMTVISRVETLRDQPRMSLEVLTELQLPGLREALESAVRSTVTQSEVTILPRGEYPRLSLSISHGGLRLTSGFRSDFYTVFLVRLEFFQAVALPSARGTASVSTWDEGKLAYAASGADTSQQVMIQARALLQEFAQRYESVNPPPTAPASAAVTVPTPPRIQDLATAVYRYEAVPDGFVPPMPMGEKDKVQVFMPKTTPGTLVSASLGLTGFNNLGDISGRRMPPQQTPAWIGVLEDWEAAEAELGPQTILRCEYKDYGSFHFWFRRRPTVADAARLRSRLADHPLLGIGPPQSNCPSTARHARYAKGAQ